MLAFAGRCASAVLGGYIVDWFGFQTIFVTTAILQVPFRLDSCQHFGGCLPAQQLHRTSTAQLCSSCRQRRARVRGNQTRARRSARRPSWCCSCRWCRERRPAWQLRPARTPRSRRRTPRRPQMTALRPCVCRCCCARLAVICQRKRSSGLIGVLYHTAVMPLVGQTTSGIGSSGACCCAAGTSSLYSLFGTAPNCLMAAA